MSDNTTAYIGLDVHKDSITAACVGNDCDAPVIDIGTVGSQQYAIDRLCKKLSGRGRLRFVYEAGPCGFELQRYLASRGYECQVAAPSTVSITFQFDPRPQNEIQPEPQERVPTNSCRMKCRLPHNPKNQMLQRL